MAHSGHAPGGLFTPAPPLPRGYGRTAAVALGIGLFGGFVAGLYALGMLAFGWPAGRFAAVVQAHGQAQTLGLAGLLILGVGAILLPGFWSAKLAHPERIPRAALLVGVGLAAQLIGQPLEPGLLRALLLALAALLPPVGFLWAGLELTRPRLQRAGRPAPWEGLLLLAAETLALALLVRLALLLSLALSGSPAQASPLHQAVLVLELDGFVLGATLGVQLRLLPALARTGPAPGWAARPGLALLVLAVHLRALAATSADQLPAALGDWLLVAALLALFLATGLPRPGLAPPGQTRWVLRVAWAGLLVGAIGRATGVLPEDTARHALTSVYLLPLVLVVGVRLLPRVSAYPIRFPRLSGALVWAGLLGGTLRAFAGLFLGQLGWQIAWVGGLLLALAMLVFALLAWSPWGVPRGIPRDPEVYRQQARRG